jgi:hypothetical protein
MKLHCAFGRSANGDATGILCEREAGVQLFESTSAQITSGEDHCLCSQYDAESIIVVYSICIDQSDR